MFKTEPCFADFPADDTFAFWKQYFSWYVIQCYEVWGDVSLKLKRPYKQICHRNGWHILKYWTLYPFTSCHIPVTSDKLEKLWIVNLFNCNNDFDSWKESNIPTRSFVPIFLILGFSFRKEKRKTRIRKSNHVVTCKTTVNQKGIFAEQYTSYLLHFHRLFEISRSTAQRTTSRRRNEKTWQMNFWNYLVWFQWESLYV